MPKSNNNVPIFLQDTKSQKENKPTIEDVCDYFLKDSTLKAGMEQLLDFLQRCKLKSSWIGINAYRCAYKGKTVVYINFGGGKDYEINKVVISIALADKEDLQKVILVQSEDLLKEFINRTVTHCRICQVHCDFGVKIELLGVKHHFCSRFNYMCKNPTPKQFEIIEKFISIRKDYLNLKTNSNKS